MPKFALLGVACTALVAAWPSPHLASRIRTGAAPAAASAAFGAVWVTNDGAGTLARIDPARNRVTRRVRLRPGVFSLTHGFGALWTINYKRQSLTRIDPPTGRVRSVRVGRIPFDVLAAYGPVWVTAWDAGRLVEVDPYSLQVLRRIPIGSRPTGLHAADGGLWVGFGRKATAIARVDPGTLEVERLQVGVRAPSWFVAGARGLWIVAADHVLLHVDPVTRRVEARLSFGRTLAQGALAPDGTIWVPDKEQSVVYRVDPKQARVLDSFPAGPGAFFALRAHGSMWVTSYAGDDVWRFQPAGH